MKNWLLLSSLVVFSCDSLARPNAQYLSCGAGTACPVVTGFTPLVAAPENDTLMTLSGQNFVAGMTVLVGTTNLPTTLVSSTELQFTLANVGVPTTCGPRMAAVTLQTPDGKAVNPQPLQIPYKYTKFVFTQKSSVPVAANAQTVAAGPIDSRAGDDVMVMGSFDNQMYFLAVNNDGTVTSSLAPISLPAFYVNIMLPILGPVQHTDVVLRYLSRLLVCPSTGDVTTLCKTNTPYMGDQYDVVLVADLDGKNNKDIVWFNKATMKLRAMLATTSPMYAPPIDAYTFGVIAVSNNFQLMVSGDFDHNGLTDIAALSPSDQAITIVTGNGQGAFAAFNRIQVPDATNPENINLIATMPGDNNLPDYLIIPSQNALYTAISSGATMKINKLDTLSASPNNILIEDVDCDGLKDVILYYLNGAQTLLYINNGNGNFTKQPLANLPSQVNSMATANFGISDSKPDLVVLGLGSSPTLYTYSNDSQ